MKAEVKKEGAWILIIDSTNNSPLLLLEWLAANACKIESVINPQNGTLRIALSGGYWNAHECMYYINANL